jgi:hypothetical protein
LDFIGFGLDSRLVYLMNLLSASIVLTVSFARISACSYKMLSQST